MGAMRFLVCPPDRIRPEVAELAYMAGFERIPWRTRARWINGQLIVERSASDSGNMFVPWPVEGHGVVTLSTASLMERAEPYYLPLELARGKIAQTRNQLADWQAIGLVVPQSVHTKLDEAMAQFILAVGGPPGGEESTAAAETALRLVLDAGALLAECYAEQALTVRRRQNLAQTRLLGVDLGVTILDEHAAEAVVDAFNAARVTMAWREIETSEGSRDWEIFDKQLAWCRKQGLPVCGGPLLQLTTGSSPDWLYLFEGDFAALQASVSDFVEATVTRYKGQIDLWQCGGRINTGETLSLHEEEQVQLAVQVVEQVRALDPHTPMVVSFDQPWSEYVARRDVDFPPYYFADSLVRANLGLAGLMLELNWGYQPGGTLPRDPLDLSRTLDLWSGLGMPLYLSVCVPSGSHSDPFARSKALPLGPERNVRTQQLWLARHLPVVLAKPYVRGIFWGQLHDYAPHDFAHGGLFDLRRHPKPALRTLASLKRACF
ncbi:MAG: hypothetical protein JW818_07255 [Pirellulales bacterium]|nr:hypothetical protein [Pirellulales bacterium]